ncbi:MAG: arginase family protein [Candidatus Aenigmarchaeota archaeon]|nr:arginase family protein [Candidatus Aenigmarchaeota archaeon]
MIYTMRTFSPEFPLEEADACLVGVPWDSTQMGKSVKYGPLFIRQALREMEGFDLESKNDLFDSKFCDLGDVEVVPGNWLLTQDRIVDTMEHIRKVNPKAFPILLGGEHLISLGALAGLGSKVTVVQFDAHADISKEWMGEKYSQITWAHHAKQMGMKLVQLGVRSCTKEEFAGLVEAKLGDVAGPVYLTVDMDVFDPSHAPDVSLPEPIGMLPAEFFSLLKKVCSHELVGMDIVECSADRVGTATSALAANIIKKVMLWKK